MLVYSQLRLAGLANKLVELEVEKVKEEFINPATGSPKIALLNAQIEYLEDQIRDGLETAKIESMGAMSEMMGSSMEEAMRVVEDMERKRLEGEDFQG